MKPFKFKVRITDYERGWGPSFDSCSFDTYEEAVKFIEKINSKNTAREAPDFYSVAEPANFVIEN